MASQAESLLLGKAPVCGRFTLKPAIEPLMTRLAAEGSKAVSGRIIQAGSSHQESLHRSFLTLVNRVLRIASIVKSFASQG